MRGRTPWLPVYDARGALSKQAAASSVANVCSTRYKQNKTLTLQWKQQQQPAFWTRNL